MADNIQKTLDIKVNYSEALDGVAKYRMELDRAKAEAKAMTDILKEYDKALKDGSISETEYSKRVLEVQKSLAANKQEQNQLSDAIRTSEKVIKNQITQQNLADDSIKALRAQLSNLTKEYDELSASQRDNAEVGGKLLASINDVTDQIKEAEEATQRYYRNVGNYKSALEGMEKATDGAKNSILGFISGGNPLVQMLVNTSQQLGSVKQAFVVVAQGASMLGKQLLALMANPIVAFLAAIAAAFMVLKSGIESSEERMNKFRVIMAPMKMVFDVVSVAIGKVCGVLLDLVGLASDAIMWLNKMAESLPILGKHFAEQNKKVKEYIDLEKQRQEITRLTRDEVVKSAEREREISDLRAKFAEKDKYTNEERLKFLDQAIAKEKEQAEANKRLAQMRLENLEREAALADNDAEMNDKLAQAKAEVIKADTALSNKMRELNAQRVEAINGINAEAEAVKKAEAEKAKAWQETIIKRKKIEVEYSRKVEDAELELVDDEYEKQKVTITVQYEREIGDLRKQLEEEENLTESAKESINQLIIAKQKQLNRELAALDKERLSTEEQLWREAEDAMLDLIKGGYEKQKQVVATQYQREIEDLQKRLDEENSLTESAKEALRSLIISKRQQMNNEIQAIEKSATDEQIQREAERIQLQQDADRLSLEARMSNLQEGTMQMLNLQREQADQEFSFRQANIDREYQQEQERINALAISEQEKNDMLLNLQLDYGNKSKENEQKLADEKKKIAKAEAQMKIESYNSIKSGIDAMGEHSKAFAIMSKAIALGEIAVNTGKALAAGIAQAQSVPFPANLVAIATTVGTILANIASAISTVKSAKFAKGGTVDTSQYASGGDVRGAGTGTSDSIHAMLSNGESVMTAAATSMYAPVLSAMNQSAGGNPITGGGSAQGEDMLARAVARGLMAMPNPVVSVEEINTTSRRVQVLENLASI